MADPVRYRYPDGRILVFAKAPLAGRVKTRLAAGIGDRAALALYTQLMRDTVDTAVQAGLAPVTLCTDSPHSAFDALGEKYDIATEIQQGADLGMRMHNAMQHALAQADFVVLIGTDCPLMSAGYLAQACLALHTGTECVLGPADDGGYVLIGARSAEQGLFSDMRWSTGQVMQHTRERLRLLNRRHIELETLWDLDTPEDLERWQALSRSAVTA
ncbi:MAG: TIGR04282 family arsenosugar biosynthesis glycosyltransferase [Thiogranum sp.]